MNLPTISIVTPVLNEAKTLRETLSSVLMQTYAPHEHIIVDSGSTDGTLEIINEYKAQAPYKVILLTTPPGGVYAALNNGSELATADLLGLLHGDDSYTSPHILEFIATAMARNPQVELVYGDVHFVNDAGKRTRHYSGAHFVPEKLRIGLAFPHPSMYIRRSLFDKYGPYNLSFRISSDYEYIVRLTLKNRVKILYLPIDMVAMHEGGLASQWSSRLWHHPREKFRALKINGHATPFWKLLGRYIYLFRH